MKNAHIALDLEAVVPLAAGIFREQIVWIDRMSDEKLYQPNHICLQCQEKKIR